MKTKPAPSSIFEKDRIRHEINSQVEDFLRAGGQINVLTDTNRTTRMRSVGSAWSDPDDFVHVPEQP